MAALVAAGCIQGYLDTDAWERLDLLKSAVAALKGQTHEPFLLLLPGGFFGAWSEKTEDAVAWAVDQTAMLLRDARAGSVVCLGIDGPEDQLGLAIRSTGLAAAARKFYVQRDEETRPAAGPFDRELGKKRVFRFDDRAFYLAVCYDTYGIWRLDLPNPGVDGVVNLVHSFQPDESPQYFAKFGFAGASRTWDCPVFGAVVFTERRILPEWPTCVQWSMGDLELKRWKYEHNPAQPSGRCECRTTTERMEIRLYPLEGRSERRARHSR